MRPFSQIILTTCYIVLFGIAPVLWKRSLTLLPCVTSLVGNPPREAQSLSGLVHEEAHPSISYHTQPSFNDIEARGPNRLLIQPIPPVDYSVRKKVPVVSVGDGLFHRYSIVLNIL